MAESNPTTNDPETTIPPAATPQTTSSSDEDAIRKKYPTPAAGRSALLEKRLSRGVPKFFDSGDYNLAKAANDPKNKHKLNLGYHGGPTSPLRKGLSPSPLANYSVNPMLPDNTPPTTPPDPSAATEPMPRPPSSITLNQRRLSRQKSRLVDDVDLPA